MMGRFRHISVLTLFAFITMNTNLVALAEAFVPDEPVITVQGDCHGHRTPAEQEPADKCPDSISPCQICAIVSGALLTDRVSIGEGFACLPLTSLTGIAPEADPDPPRNILL